MQIIQELVQRLEKDFKLISAGSRALYLNSTETELVAADYAMGPILWTKHLLVVQGYDYKQILHQDDTSDYC